MAIYFSSITKLVGDRARVIVPHPDKVLINLNMSVPKTLSSEYLYVLHTAALPAYQNLEEQNLMVIESEGEPVPPEYFKVTGLNMIIAKDDASAGPIIEDIVRLFDDQAKISNFAYGLMSISCESSNVQKVLDAGYSILNNPLLLVDTSFSLIAHSGAYAGINDSTISYCLEKGQMPEVFLNDMVNETYQQTDPDFPGILVMDAPDGKGSAINSVRVIRDGQLLGYVKLFEYNHPSTFIEKNCLMILAGFVALSLVDSLPRLPNAKVQIEDFLTDIFSRKLVSSEAIENRVALYHLDTNRELQVISIKYDRLVTSIDQLYFYKRQLQTAFNTSMVTFYNQLIIMVVFEDTLKEKRQNLENFLKDHHLYCGISMKFKYYTSLYKYYSQTLACLDIRSYFNLDDHIIDYSEWNLVHMFLHFQDYCSLEELIPEDVRILQEIDHAKGSNLTETLFSFVHNRQDITNSAAEMHLHYNTMKYRINRILELTDIVFTDPKIMYRIIIAEKAMSIINRIPPNFM